MDKLHFMICPKCGEFLKKTDINSGQKLAKIYKCSNPYCKVNWVEIGMIK